MSREIHLRPLTADRSNSSRQVGRAASRHAPPQGGRPVRWQPVHRSRAGGPRCGSRGAHTEALRHALLSPVDELPDDARFALHVAAVLGQYIPHEVLEGARSTVRGGNVAANLRLSPSAGCSIAADERYDFRHAIVRESVVGDAAQRTDGRTPGRRPGIRLSRRDGMPAGLAQLAHHLVAAGEYVARFRRSYPRPTTHEASMRLLRRAASCPWPEKCSGTVSTIRRRSAACPTTTCCLARPRWHVGRATNSRGRVSPQRHSDGSASGTRPRAAGARVGRGAVGRR